ncbi:unnamed protein product, partial [Musa textilis]
MTKKVEGEFVEISSIAAVLVEVVCVAFFLPKLVDLKLSVVLAGNEKKSSTSFEFIVGIKSINFQFRSINHRFTF